MVAKDIIVTAKAPTPIGPYSQAVRSGDLLFCSGQVGLDPHTKELVPGGIEAQAKQIMLNLAAVLEAAGCQFANIIKVTIFLRNMSDFALVNKIYSSYFIDKFPARSTVSVVGLPLGALVEIEAIARL